jgi:O-antigen/teichoic acid export membrane protein
MNSDQEQTIPVQSTVERDHSSYALGLRLSKDSGLYILSQSVPALIGFLAVAVYTRILPPEEYGLYVLVSTIGTLVSSVVFGWLSLSTFRYFSQSQQNHRLSALIATSIFAWIILFLLVAIIWLNLTSVMPVDLDNHTLLIWQLGLVVVGTLTLYTLVQRLIQADMRSVRYVLNSVIFTLVGFMLSVFLTVQFQLGAEGLLLAKALAAGFLFLTLVPWVRVIFNGSSFSFSKSILIEMAGYGVPFVGIFMGQWILDSADRIILQWFMSAKEVGIYSAGYTLANQSMVIIFQGIILATEPVMVNLYESSRMTQVRRVLEDSARVYLIIAIPAIVIIIVFAENIGSLIFGPMFLSASLVLPWIAGGVFCYGLGQLFSKPFELRKQTSRLLWILLPSCVINIGLNLALVPRFGMIGAAQATFGAYVAYCFITRILGAGMIVWRFPWETLTKVVLSTTPIYFVGKFVHMPSLDILTFSVELGLGAIGYFVVLILLRERTLIQGFSIVVNAFTRYGRSHGNS